MQTITENDVTWYGHLVSLVTSQGLSSQRWIKHDTYISVPPSHNDTSSLGYIWGVRHDHDKFLPRVRIPRVLNTLQTKSDQENYNTDRRHILGKCVDGSPCDINRQWYKPYGSRKYVIWYDKEIHRYRYGCRYGCRYKYI
jgi:hypothetical protein